MAVAVLTTVQLAYNLSRARKVEQLAWLLAAAGALGLSIWAMHFICMLAWRSQPAWQFKSTTLLLAVWPVLIGSAVALLVVVSRRPRLQRVLIGAVVLTASVLLMQQLSYFAIGFAEEPGFDPVILLLSALLALVTSSLLLAVISLRIQQAPLGGVRTQQLSAALLVATGFAGMCFSGLLALEPSASAAGTGEGAVDGHWLAILSGSNLLVCLLGLMLISWMDRRRLLTTQALSQRKLRSARRLSEAIDEQARELTLALQKSQQRLALAMEGSQDGLWDVDVAANEVLLSRRMAMMLGLGTQGVTLDSTAVLELLDPAQRVRLLRALCVHWRSRLQRPLDCDLLVLSEGGSRRRCLHLRGSSVLDDQGRPQRVAGSLSDVTLVRQHEGELQGAAALIEQHPDAMLVLDHSGRIESINAAALRLLGLGRTELSGRGLAPLLRRVRTPGVLKLLRNCWLSGVSWQGLVALRVVADGDQQRSARLWLSGGRITAAEGPATCMVISARLWPDRAMEGQGS